MPPRRLPARPPRVYLYVVDRDFGFAPNPFHGSCTLATCKPVIRGAARVGDWVFGMGGGSLKATGQCVFAMRVTQKLTFNEYWHDVAFAGKKPVRNGSKAMIMGDNIYVQGEDEAWQQLPSHHSHPDGRANHANVQKDTQQPHVLISRHFYYFGRNARLIPPAILQALGYQNGRGHRVFSVEQASQLLDWVEQDPVALNKVLGDPFDFDKSTAHYSAATNKITYG